MSAVVLNGVFVGLICGLLRVGLVLVYRGSRVVSFAYGNTGIFRAFFLHPERALLKVAGPPAAA